MQNFRLAVGGYGSVGELPVCVHPLFLANVPHKTGLFAVSTALRLRQEIRIHLVEEVLGSAGIPMRHSSEILWSHHAAGKRIVHYLLAQFSTELQRPKKRAVVVDGVLSGKRLRRVRIGADLRERLLKDVVLSNAKHE